MTDSQFASLVCTRKANHQRSELILSARGINMRFKLVMRTLVDLVVRKAPLSSYVEFVQFRNNNRFKRTEINCPREQEPLDNIHNIIIKGIKRSCKLGIVKFPSRSIFCVVAFLIPYTERSRIAI